MGLLPSPPNSRGFGPELLLLVILGKCHCLNFSRALAANFLRPQQLGACRGLAVAPRESCPTHLITCPALLFLGNVYIPDTLLSPQSFSRLCIFHIAEQGPGLAAGGSCWVTSALPAIPPRYSHLQGLRGLPT